MNSVLIYLFAFIALFISFGIGIFAGLYLAFEATQVDEDDEEQFPDVYCFQCEMEMPTKVRKGKFCCGNCGLKH